MCKVILRKIERELNDWVRFKGRVQEWSVCIKRNGFVSIGGLRANGGELI